MKRIILAISFVSFAAQAPVHAESKVLAMLIKPEHKQVLEQVGSAICADAKTLTAQSGEIAKEVLSGAETALKMPFVALSCGTKGLEYLGNNYPLVGAALFAGLSVKSFKKAFKYDRDNEGKSLLCGFAGIGAALATMVYGVTALDKYTRVA